MKRRRAIKILAGASGAVLTGCRSWSQERAARWKGVLFNAEVDLAIHGLPSEDSRELIRRCVAEMQRLEGLFSLYVPDSVLVRLNREGEVVGAPPEFVALVEDALSIAQRSEGAFDPTVQPYWVWLREAVESGRKIEEGARRRELARVDYRKVQVAGQEVRFASEGMSMTLNGIAQGWITDRICDLLREAGARHCLVNLGEYFAIGTRPSGEDWRVGIRGGGSVELSLRERALAVSSGAGLYFGTGAGKNHLIDPRNGECAEDRRIVAVTASRAVLADALSTACAVMGDQEAAALVEHWEEVEVRILRPA